jgi:hypothetical protein
MATGTTNDFNYSRDDITASQIAALAAWFVANP